MTYIILAAGEGARLRPLTLRAPKTLYRLDKGTTILQRTVRAIRRFDPDAEVVVVAGFMYDHVLAEVADENAIVIRNPFYAETGSIASLWFAREYLERDDVTVLSSDIVAEDRAFEGLVCRGADRATVLVDSGRRGGKLRVQSKGGRVFVMSSSLAEGDSRYMCVTKLDAVSARFLAEEVSQMVCAGMYDLLFEDALVQMVFERDFELYCEDVHGLDWVEVDEVDDLVLAREIHGRSTLGARP